MPPHSPRLLLIDDNRHGLLGRRINLQEQGYEVETACSAGEGLSKLRAGHFDLVVTDYRLPDQPGTEVVRLAKEVNPRLPIVILSGYASKVGLTKKSTGADEVLAKGPSELQELSRAIARLLRKMPASEPAHPGERGKAARTGI